MQRNAKQCKEIQHLKNTKMQYKEMQNNKMQEIETQCKYNLKKIKMLENARKYKKMQNAQNKNPKECNNT